MRLKQISRGAAALLLDGDDCLALARICAVAAENQPDPAQSDAQHYAEFAAAAFTLAAVACLAQTCLNGGGDAALQHELSTRRLTLDDLTPPALLTG